VPVRTPVERPDELGTVLVVEDEPAIRRYVAGVLEAQGSRVRAAGSGEAALETLGGNAVDIALVGPWPCRASTG